MEIEYILWRNEGEAQWHLQINGVDVPLSLPNINGYSQAIAVMDRHVVAFG